MKMFKIKNKPNVLQGNTTDSSQAFHQKAQKILGEYYNTKANPNECQVGKLKLFISPRKDSNQLSDKIYKAKFDIINRKNFKLKNNIFQTPMINKIGSNRNYTSLSDHRLHYSITNSESSRNTQKRQAVLDLLHSSGPPSRVVTPLKLTANQPQTRRINFDKFLSIAANPFSKTDNHFICHSVKGRSLNSSKFLGL